MQNNDNSNGYSGLSASVKCHPPLLKKSSSELTAREKLLSIVRGHSRLDNGPVHKQDMPIKSIHQPLSSSPTLEIDNNNLVINNSGDDTDMLSLTDSESSNGNDHSRLKVDHSDQSSSYQYLGSEYGEHRNGVFYGNYYYNPNLHEANGTVTTPSPALDSINSMPSEEVPMNLIFPYDVNELGGYYYEYPVPYFEFGQYGAPLVYDEEGYVGHPTNDGVS